MTKLSEIIKTRKSVRTFDGRRISQEHRKELEEYSKLIRNPFGIPVRFVFLDAKEYGLSSPVLAGEELYVAGITEKRPYADVAYGYSFEKLVLRAWSYGIGTTWIGGTMKREQFEKVAGVGTDEMMPCVSPLGYPANKKSLKESMMRKGIGADNRLSIDKLFFADEWGKTLITTDEMSDILEMVRWSPSAVNRQPWRILFKDDVWHFYEKKDRGYESDKTGDLQKIDVGIALCHFTMGVEELGKNAVVTVSDPVVVVPDDVTYVASVKISI
ncbi:MAG: nitroreductase [Lachnospiraceae bacterium]|jgi:nitroreductase|nr:nitroreductase [Lachnospiraceae bacterium]